MKAIAIFACLLATTTALQTPVSTHSKRAPQLARWAGQSAPRSLVVRKLAEDEEVAEANFLSNKAAEEEEAASAKPVTATWVDPNANSGVAWWQLSWWGYLLILYPTALYLDDSLHFFPLNSDGQRANLMDIIHMVQGLQGQ